MKAERRHQLQTNSLAQAMENFPIVLRVYGSQIMLGLIVVLLLFVVIRWRLNQGREREATAALSLSMARSYIDEIRGLPQRVPPEALASFARTTESQASAAITEAINAADDPRALAEARVARGNLNWALANLPESPAAATRPSAGLEKTPEQYLQDAADAYQAVLDDPKAPIESIVTARLSLAAVAENWTNWEKARAHYESVINDERMAEPHKRIARERIEQLKEIRGAPLLATTTSVEPEEPTTTTAPVIEGTSKPADVEKPEVPKGEVEKPDEESGTPAVDAPKSEAPQESPDKQ